MKVKVIIIFLSMLGSTFLVSGGYGYWEKTLKITGEIEVLPDPDLHSKQPESPTLEVDEMITDIQENVTQENSEVISPQSNEENKSEEMNEVIDDKQKVIEGKDTPSLEVNDLGLGESQLPTAENTGQALSGEDINPSPPEVGEQK